MKTKIFFALLLALATHADQLQAQTFGSGTIGQVSISSRSGLVVGSTTIAPSAGLIGAQAIGTAILTLNAAAGTSPAPIAIQTTGDDHRGETRLFSHPNSFNFN